MATLMRPVLHRMNLATSYTARDRATNAFAAFSRLPGHSIDLFIVILSFFELKYLLVKKIKPKSGRLSENLV